MKSGVEAENHPGVGQIAWPVLDNADQRRGLPQCPCKAFEQAGDEMLAKALRLGGLQQELGFAAQGGTQADQGLGPKGRGLHGARLHVRTAIRSARRRSKFQRSNKPVQILKPMQLG